MKNVGYFLLRLVDVAGPPDQPAFLAPVSATGLELAPRVADRQNGHVERTHGPRRLLHPLSCRAARDQEPDQKDEERSSTWEHGHLLKPLVRRVTS